MIGNKKYCKPCGRMNNFTLSKTYLYLGEDKNSPLLGKFLNDKKQVEIILKENFELDSNTKEIRRIISLVNNKNMSLSEYQEYSCYGVIEKNTTTQFNIIDNNYNDKYYDSEYFISKEEFIQIKDQPDGEKILKEKSNKIYEKLNAKENYKKESKDIQNILNLMNESTITNDIKENFKDYNFKSKSHNQKLTKTIILLILISLLSPIFSIKTPLILLYYISVIAVSYFALGLNSKCIKTVKDIESLLELTSEKYDYDLYKLPDEILAKIKRVELLIKKLSDNKVDKDIIKLLKNNIKLSSILVIKTDTDENKKELNDLLDNSTKYCNSLLENKNNEKEYIENAVAKNISDTIKNNNELFKSMLSENSKIYKKNN